MPDRIDSDLGESVDSAAVGKEIWQRVNRYDGHQTVNVDLHHMPTTEEDRRVWMTYQILDLRKALIGDELHGDGLVGSVKIQRAWLVLVSILLAALILMMAWQQLQINEIIQQLSEIAR